MNEIKENVLKGELTYKNTVILTYEIHYPEIVRSDTRLGKIVFNQYNKQIAQELEKQAKEELFYEAKEVYDYNIGHGYPIMVYEVIQNYTITYNVNQIISLYIDQYLFQGGAHGMTTRTSQNWNLIVANQIPLYQLYPNNPYFLLDILKQINTQIENQKEYYFENSCQLVLETFHPENYYMTNQGIYIFFQHYDIAPYSTGIPVFAIRA